MKWFGITIVDPEGRKTETPIGATCGFCQEPITAQDHGGTVPNAGGDETPYHFECHIRLVIGSLAHQQRRCSCYGGAEHDPPDMTLREAAQAAFKHWMEHRGKSC